MSDNLKLTMGIKDVEELLGAMELTPSEYCALYTTNPSDTVIITTNDGLKLLLLNNHNAEEISDWDFNDMYSKETNSNRYTLIGNSSFVDKGY